jgi:hypothetical protein
MSDARTEYYPNRARLALVMIGALALVAGAAYIVSSPEGRFSPRALIAAWIGMPVFALGAGYLLLRVVRHRPSVVLDAEGVHDNGSMASVGLIPWHEIETARVFEMGGKTFAAIVLKRQEAFLPRVKGLRGKLAKSNAGMGFPLVSIPELALSIPAARLVQDINARLAKASLSSSQAS